LLGLNASGKTTLLRAIGGLLKPIEGRCLMGEDDFTALNEHDRARYISYTPQRHSPMYGVTVFDAVMMGFNASLGLFESPGREEKRLAGQTLERLGMSSYSQADFASLSEGQKQMVILARTLAQNAPVMLLDEPDSALDFINRHAILRKVRDLIKEEGKIGLISIHDPNYALKYCDRLLMLSKGEIVAELKTNGADCPALEACLAAVYGEVSVIEREGQFIMLQKRH
jgi:iron complex transport system ATP-binding protein